MRILHTADWHVGRRLGRHDRMHEHRAALDVEPLAPHSERLDPVVDDVDLPAAVHLGADRLADHGVVHGDDVRVDREAVLRGGLDDGQVADAREREVQ